MSYKDPSEVLTCANCGSKYPRSMLSKIKSKSGKPIDDNLYCVDCIPT